jgi:hypothetical protein
MDIVSDEVELHHVLVDLVIGGTTTTIEGAAGGVGLHLSGNVRVKDSLVRRAARIGIWADGFPGPQRQPSGGPDRRQ